MIYKSLLLLAIISITSCSFAKRIKDGEMAYERKQYAVAIELLEEEYSKASSEAIKSRKAWLTGQSYLKLLEYENAKIWIDKSVKHNYGVEALAVYAKICRHLEDYDGAMTAYKKIAETTGRKQETDRDILVCKQAIEMKNKKPEYQVERVFENTSVSDYSPVIFDDQYLVFTSERKEVTGNDVYNWTGERYSDIFIMLKSGSEVRRFDASINTTANEGTPWFSKDMQTIYFTRCSGIGSGDDFCKLMYAERVDGIWDEPEVLPFIQDKINYGHPTLIENDSVLVFSADIEQPGGSTDLYYAELFNDGTWSQPEKLPSTINSQGNEKFPTGDRDTLYFSSDFLPGMGGYDLFKTFLRSDGTWSIPYNLGYPINSGGDDFSFVVDYNPKIKPNIIQQGFFVSSRTGSGKDDIFRFSKMVDVKKPNEEIAEETAKTIFVTVTAYTPTYLIPNDPNSGYNGKVGLGETFVKISDEQNKLKINESYTDNNGFYFSEIPEGKSIKIIGAKLGYLNASATISTKNLVFGTNENSKTINVELILDKIYSNKEINLQNIYYDYDKWDIKAEAKPTLDRLVKLLNDNPQINIQLSSHTDCRGEVGYNEELSQKRAQSVIDYLILNNIQPYRLTAKGYGESQLLDTCLCEDCTEEQHQINRRTTFKILSK